MKCFDYFYFYHIYYNMVYSGRKKYRSMESDISSNKT